MVLSVTRLLATLVLVFMLSHCAVIPATSGLPTGAAVAATLLSPTVTPTPELLSRSPSIATGIKPSVTPPGDALSSTAAPPTALPLMTLSPVAPLSTASAGSPIATAVPHLMSGATIEGLRARDYAGGPIEILRTLETTDAFTRYYIAYPSDGLRITGIMQVPPGDGRFPVIILNHGYIERGSYWSGSDTWMAAEYFNRRGYLTVAPDMRSWGESDWGPSFFHTGLVADVLNLISSLSYVPQADAARLGMFGHSMGGGITTKTLTIDPRVRAAVLYAPNSANDGDLIARWGRGCLPGETQYTTMCNPAEVLLEDLPPEVVEAYLSAAVDPAMLEAIAPIHHLDAVTAPVQIHIGTVDGQVLNETPPEWSVRLHEALAGAGKSSELFVYEGQGHLFHGQDWSQMMERSADFFDAHLR